MSDFITFADADGTRSAVLADDVYCVTELKKPKLREVGTIRNECSILVAGLEDPVLTTLDFDTVLSLLKECAVDDEEVDDDEV